MGPVRAVPGAPSGDRYRVSGFHRRIFLPSGPEQNARRIAFEFPVLDIALLVLDVDVNETVRIGPFDLRDDSCQCNRSCDVVFDSKGVMHEKQRSPKKKTSYTHRPTPKCIQFSASAA